MVSARPREGSSPSLAGALRNAFRRVSPGYLFIAPVVIYLLALGVYPLITTIYMGFMEPHAGGWRFVGLGHYVRTLADPWFWNSVKVTALFTLMTVVLHLGIALSLALLLNADWFSTRLRNIMRGLLILPWVFSTAAAGLMWSLLYHPFGVVNYALLKMGAQRPIEFLGTPGVALAALIAVNVWKSFPLYMILVLGGLQSIPHELYEAARVDGAGGWQRFRYVTLPQLRGVLVAVTSIDLITTVGHVDLVRILTTGGPFRTTETSAFYIYKTALLDGHLGYGSAMSTLMLIMLGVVTYVYVKTASRGADSGETRF